MLETNRLFLRRMNETDADYVFAMRSDEEIMRFIRPIQTQKKETESWIKLISSRWETEKIGFCAIIEKETKSFAGWCGLWRLNETGETEIGYALLKEFWGKGYAVEAANAFLKYGFEELKREKIVAVADPDNQNSRRVMENVGMKFDYVGFFYERDLVHYSILREDFLTPRRRDAKGAK
ncbi:MAG TPA: GNAT family N-acetyltransferase [Pyrinomonadaceae bacterium]|nr:GNAT family N-acetyltransferase [Pyrinomonadaceae bacterium]